MRRILIIVAAFVFAVPAFASVDQDLWQYAKEIHTSGSGVTVVELDVEAFQSLKPDLSDLRIVDQSGVEQPYVLQVEKDVLQTSLAGARMLNRAYVEEEGFQQFELDLGSSGVLHNRVEIKTSEDNFQHQVQVYGRDNGSWKLLKGGGVIFDYTNTKEQIHADELGVSYPESSYRYLQVRIFSSAPFVIHSAQVFQKKVRRGQDALYDVSLTQSEDASGNTVLDLDLGHDQLPTNKIMLETKAKNFDRPAQVWVQTEEGDYRRVSHDYLFVYDTDSFSGQNLTLQYGGSSVQHLRVIVLNGDDTPVAFSGASVAGSVRSVIFEAADAAYRLLYDNPRADRPVYDIERRLKFLDVSGAKVASLGPQITNENFVPLLPPLSERMPWLLPLVLVLASILMVGMMVRHLKAVRQ